MSRDITRQLLRDQIEEIWSKGRTELVDKNYAPEIIDHMPVAGQPKGRDALKDVVTLLRMVIPDMRMELHHIMAAGDYGVDVWTLSGTHTGNIIGEKATGANIRF